MGGADPVLRAAATGISRGRSPRACSRIETYLGLAVAALGSRFPTKDSCAGVYIAVALLAINEWIIKRLMEQARAQGTALGLSFGAWHGVSMVGYLIGCLLVLGVIWKGRI